MLKNKVTRFLILVIGSALAIGGLYYSDPNDGALTAILIGKLVTPIIAVWFAHLARKGLAPYIDMEQIYKKSLETATGAGMAFLGMCILIFALLGLFGTQVRAQEGVPPKAHLYLPMVKAEQERLWPTHPKPGCSVV